MFCSFEVLQKVSFPYMLLLLDENFAIIMTNMFLIKQNRLKILITSMQQNFSICIQLLHVTVCSLQREPIVYVHKRFDIKFGFQLFKKAEIIFKRSLIDIWDLYFQ